MKSSLPWLDDQESWSQCQVGITGSRLDWISSRGFQAQLLVCEGVCVGGCRGAGKLTCREQKAWVKGGIRTR